MPEELVLMIVLVVMTITVGGVTLLKPITKPLAALLESMIRDREARRDLPDRDLSRIRELLENVENRMTLLEERQGFYEALHSSGASERRAFEDGASRGNRHQVSSGRSASTASEAG